VIELTLVGVRVELPTNTPIVLLKERDGERFLPIFIGAVEATAIAFALQGIDTQRPMTHDLMRDLLREAGATLDRVEITELLDGTFYSSLHFSLGGKTHEVTSRPSDAIALAVRTGAPIFAAPTVLDEASIPIREEGELGESRLEIGETDDAIEQFREFLETVNPEDFRG
jgi:bifunctional DNase/RNase